MLNSAFFIPSLAYSFWNSGGCWWWWEENKIKSMHKTSHTFINLYIHVKKKKINCHGKSITWEIFFRLVFKNCYFKSSVCTRTSLRFNNVWGNCVNIAFYLHYLVSFIWAIARWRGWIRRYLSEWTMFLAINWMQNAMRKNEIMIFCWVAFLMKKKKRQQQN